MMEDPDQPLLAAIAGGSEEALGELIDRYREKLFRFVYRIVRNEADAAEIVSETFVRVHRYSANYRPKAKVVTWIYTITTNLCRDHHRREKRRRFLSLFSVSEKADGETGASLADRIADTGPPADESLLQSERHRRALELIDALPPKLKSPFILNVLEEHSQKECAELLGVSEKTIETRVYRARQRLREGITDLN